MNAARCFSGTRATVRFSKATVVTSGSRLQRFTHGDVKVEQDIVTFNEEDHEDTFVEEGPQIERGTVFLRDTCHREICKETVVTSGFRVKRVLTRAVAKWRKTL